VSIVYDGDPEPAQEASYVASVLILHAGLPDAPSRSRPIDQALARKLHQESGPATPGRVRFAAPHLAAIGSSQRSSASPRIRSLAYFLPVIAELQQQPDPPAISTISGVSSTDLAKAARPPVQ
jgi:hypothetical protein